VDAVDRATVAIVDGLVASPPVRIAGSDARPGSAAVDAVVHRLTRSERPLIACGPMLPAHSLPADLLVRVAEAGTTAVYAEATSGLRFVDAPGGQLDALPWLLRAQRLDAATSPDFVLQLGAAPTAAPWHAWLDGASVPRICVAQSGHPDPQRAAEQIINCAPASLLEAIAGRLPASQARHAWLSRLQAENDRAWRLVDAELAAHPALTEPVAVREAIDSLPHGGLLAVGNSLPVRSVDEYARAGGALARVWSQRGVSGIDGLVSGVLAAASEAAVPTLALIGDVSCLHDIGGLALAADVAVPCCLVVINNAGGRIFEQLPIRSQRAGADHLSFWTTPHDRRLRGAADMFQVRYREAATRSDLRRLLAESMRSAGVTLVEAIVPSSSVRQTTERIVALLREAP
jgi:2-succinyl-5-enolpyruvyl-6-hydroxy-3-cyclohexene-1-carboxylate synthase